MSTRRADRHAGDSFLWTPRAVVEKYDDEQVAYVAREFGTPEPNGRQLATLCVPSETVETEDNLLTTAGVTRVAALLIGTSTATLDSTRVRLGVGDTAGTALVTDIALGTNQYWRVMDATYPQAAAGVLTFVSTFGNSDANFVWACWGLDVGTATVTSSNVPATLVNRKVSALGTKASGTWVLTVTVTFS
jgi:hypothetical protein